jgi:hypothetical protein
MNRIVVSVQAPVPTAVPIMSLEVHLFSMNPLQRFSRTRVYLTGLTSTLLVLGSYEKNSEETYRYFPSDHYERQHFWNFVCRSEERSNFEIVGKVPRAWLPHGARIATSSLCNDT